jgi:hypothetical protein
MDNNDNFVAGGLNMNGHACHAEANEGGKDWTIQLARNTVAMNQAASLIC